MKIRLSPAEADAIRSAARAAGLSIGNYLRQVLGLPPLRPGGYRPRKQKEVSA